MKNAFKKLTFAFLTSALALSGGIGAVSEYNVVEEPTVARVEEPKEAVGVVSGIISYFATRGSSIIAKQIDNWGLSILNKVFKAVGLDFLASSSQPNYTKYFEEINERLTNIENTLKEIKTSIDQKEATQIIDNVRSQFDTVKNAIDPIIAGFADCADRETSATTEAEQEALLQEEEEYYENYVKNLQYTNSFAERVITLANLVTSPSSNTQNTLMRCFNVVAFDIPGIYTWDSMRIEAQQEFLVYITTTLLKSMAIANYEIAYMYNSSTSSAVKAFWNSTNESLVAAVVPAIDLLQSEMQSVLAVSSRLDSNVLTHISTGIQVNRRLGTSSFDPNVAHNVISYGKSKSFLKAYVLMSQWETAYYRFFLNAGNDALYTAMAKEYKNYLTYTGQSSSSFPFTSYLSYIGFTADDDFSTYKGLFHNVNYHHEGWSLSTEYDYLDVNIIDKSGAETYSRIGYVENPVFWPRSYSAGSGYSDKFLLFLQPNKDYVIGGYTQVRLSDSGVNGGSYYDRLPYEFKYDDVFASGTVGYCDPSWAA